MATKTGEVLFNGATYDVFDAYTGFRQPVMALKTEAPKPKIDHVSISTDTWTRLSQFVAQCAGGMLGSQAATEKAQFLLREILIANVARSGVPSAAKSSIQPESPRLTIAYIASYIKDHAPGVILIAVNEINNRFPSICIFTTNQLPDAIKRHFNSLRPPGVTIQYIVENGDCAPQTPSAAFRYLDKCGDVLDYSILLPGIRKTEIAPGELARNAAAGFRDPEPEPWKPLMTSWDLDKPSDTTAAAKPSKAPLPANALKHGAVR